jgi:hypothetical protein
VNPEPGTITRIKKIAGEYHAIKHITHRPSQTRTDGLHARIKAVVTIQQTERYNKNGGMNYVYV